MAVVKFHLVMMILTPSLECKRFLRQQNAGAALEQIALELAAGSEAARILIPTHLYGVLWDEKLQRTQ